MECSKNASHLNTKYFFISICSIEIAFILWRFVITPTRNSGTFLISFITVLILSLPPGLGLSLNIFNKKDISFFFTFGLCIGFGFVAGVWALMIQLRCPLNSYLYIGIILLIAGCLLYRKRQELKRLFTHDSYQYSLTGFLSPVAVLLFAFILLSTTWLNSYVLTDVDCQSDSYNALMILKEGRYPIVSPFLDQSLLQLNSGPLFSTLIAVITKLKNSILVNEIMAMTIISGAFLCLTIYFLASFIIKNEIILFFGGILTLTRAYLSFFNDGNLPENIAFYYASLFVVFLLYTIENKKIIFSVIAGFCLSFCLLSHPMIFLYNIFPFSLFFVTFLVSTNKNFKKDYINLLIVMSVILIFVFPYMLRLKEAQPSNKMYANDATTLVNSLPYWNGYIVLISAFVGVILIATKRRAINIYLWTYFLMVLVFVEHWRFFQILSPSWFKLEALTVPAFGSYYSYKSFWEYPSNYLSAWQAGVIIWPILIAVVTDYLHRLCQRHIKIRVLKNSANIFALILLFSFIGYEFKSAKRYPEFILKSDYNALTWIKENSSYENTLIYSPFDDSVPNYLTSFWVPIVSERKSIPFRNYNISGQFNFLSIDIPITEKVSQLQKAAYSITDSTSYNIFKDMKITHIFISGFLVGKLFNVYQNAPFVELIHYNTVPDQGTALVYKVK